MFRKWAVRALARLRILSFVARTCSKNPPTITCIYLPDVLKFLIWVDNALTSMRKCVFVARTCTVHCVSTSSKCAYLRLLRPSLKYICLPCISVWVDSFLVFFFRNSKPTTACRLRFVLWEEQIILRDYANWHSLLAHAIKPLSTSKCIVMFWKRAANAL